MSRSHNSSTSFTGLATDYARYRPSYPPAAMDALIDGLEPPLTIADIGCGTGISARLLTRRASLVYGIEPNEDMLAAARRQPAPSDAGRLEYRRANADATGLDDGKIDLVVCAQSFHWFDNEETIREFHRILRSNGRLALMWNVRQSITEADREHESLMRELQAAAEAAGRAVHRRRETDLSRYNRWFTTMHHVEFANPMILDRESLIGRAHSASYFPRNPQSAREAEKRLRAIFDRHNVEGELRLSQITSLTLALRRSIPE